MSCACTVPVYVFVSRRNCVPACAQLLVLSNSCLMFYALLSESDDTAADSPLSQQPLIFIALSFNLLSSLIYTFLFSTEPAVTAPPPFQLPLRLFLLPNCALLDSLFHLFWGNMYL